MEYMDSINIKPMLIPKFMDTVDVLIQLHEGGIRVCGFALFLVRFCGNFHFNSQYCSFKALSRLRLLQLSSCGFR